MYYKLSDAIGVNVERDYAEDVRIFIYFYFLH